MKDLKTLERIELIHPALREELKQIYEEIVEALKGKAICRFAYTIRSFSEQNILYAQGRSAPGKIVTNAKGGQSAHNFGCAVDIVLLKDTDGNGTFETASWETEKDFDGDGIADWQEIVKIFKLHAWEWGGDWHFKDAPHFQKLFGIPLAEMLRRYNAGHIIPGTNYIKL